MDVRALDLALARAWPAAEVAVGPWIARLDGGVTRRANSVLPLGEGAAPAPEKLDHWLREAEALYRARGLTPWIQVVPSTWPPRLDRDLEARGWATGIDPTLVLAGPLPDGAASRPSELDETATREWLETWWSVDPRGGDPELAAARAILNRIEAPTAFARVLGEDGACAGAALGVLAGRLLVIECVATRPEVRRRGVARSALCALGAWARARGAAGTVLSVQAANRSGVALYAGLGLETCGVYTYARPQSGPAG